MTQYPTKNVPIRILTSEYTNPIIAGGTPRLKVHYKLGTQSVFWSRSRDSRPDVQTFAMTLTYTGCRISEALALRVCDVYIEHALIYFRTLKRRTESWREVPIPENFTRELELTHRLRKRQIGKRTSKARIWQYSRSSASRHIAGLMSDAQINGPQACPKGLRHGFDIAAVESGVPLPTIALVLGHARIMTTAIYTTAVGIEYRELLKRMWHEGT